MKLKHLPLVILFLSASTLAFGQADSLSNWKYGAVVNLNFSQVALKNWAGGGQSSLAINSLISVFANYEKGDLTWGNTLDLGYGLIRQGKDSLGDPLPFVKSDDRFDFTSKFGYNVSGSKFWKYSGLFNFKTQMAIGYQDPLSKTTKISDFLAPGYGVLAIGMDHTKGNFTLFLSPVSGKFTTVNSQMLADQGAFGVEGRVLDSLGNVISESKKLRLEFGGYLKASYKKEIMKNVLLQTKIDLFSNYLHKPQNIDVNWDLLINMQVNKYITVTFGNTLVYDNDIDAIDAQTGKNIGPKIQLKQIFGAGFKYQFLSK